LRERSIVGICLRKKWRKVGLLNKLKLLEAKEVMKTSKLLRVLRKEKVVSLLLEDIMTIQQSV
jgi:hypothetical protein